MKPKKEFWLPAAMATAVLGLAVTGLVTQAQAASQDRAHLPASYDTACIDHNGSVTLAVGAAVAGDPGLTMCKVSIVPMDPAADGDYVVLTAPGGDHEYFRLGLRAKF